tara:strand:+ start:654 stop:1574 length:921 start_codon:yes stop_codon:yes gene_type:complete
MTFQEADFTEDIKTKRFDKIALKLAQKIQDICPFKTDEAYQEILIGPKSDRLSYTGYLGKRVSEFLPKIDISIDELKVLINKDDTQKQLRELYNLSQTVLIIPMMKILYEKNDSMYQSEMNRHLNLDKLETSSIGNKSMITAELYQRLVLQNIMEKEKKGNNVYHSQKNEMNYTPPEFIMPQINMSKGHQTCYRVLQKIIEEDKDNTWDIVNEYRNDNKCGFPGYMRYDIALFKSGKLYGFIEYDGKQHYEYTPYYHPNGIEDFIKQQEKDKIKDKEALRLCDGKICLRFTMKTKDIKEKMKEWMY